MRLVYEQGFSPDVFVLDPAPVASAHGMRTPHLNLDGTLCLFDPNKQQWSGDDALVHTTVQWTSRWLFHYEHWLTFGEWRGDHDQLPAPEAANNSDANTVETQ